MSWLWGLVSKKLFTFLYDKVSLWAYSLFMLVYKVKKYNKQTQLKVEEINKAIVQANLEVEEQGRVSAETEKLLREKTRALVAGSFGRNT